jgi:hypothetical protein
MEPSVVTWKFVARSDVPLAMDSGTADDVLGEGVERKLTDCNLAFLSDGEEF